LQDKREMIDATPSLEHDMVGVDQRQADPSVRRDPVPKQDSVERTLQETWQTSNQSESRQPAVASLHAPFREAVCPQQRAASTRSMLDQVLEECRDAWRLDFCAVALCDGSASRISHPSPQFGVGQKALEPIHPLIARYCMVAVNTVSNDRPIGADRTHDGRQADRHVLNSLHPALAARPRLVGERHDADAEAPKILRFGGGVPWPALDVDTRHRKS
jgi:hypothetical protein